MRDLLLVLLLAAPSVRAQSVAVPAAGDATAVQLSTPAARGGASDARSARAPRVGLDGLESSSADAIGVNFDGGAARADAAAVAEIIASPIPPQYRPALKEAAAELPDAPTPTTRPVPVPMTRGEKAADAAFWTTWWGYHAAWAADFTTTGLILSRGGFEKDPLYTRFGNQNMAGVIGSAVVVHTALSGASLLLHEEAKKHTGFTRRALEAAAIATNSVYIGVHASAAAGNVDVLHRMR